MRCKIIMEVKNTNKNIDIKKKILSNYSKTVFTFS